MAAPGGAGDRGEPARRRLRRSGHGRLHALQPGARGSSPTPRPRRGSSQADEDARRRGGSATPARCSPPRPARRLGGIMLAVLEATANAADGARVGPRADHALHARASWTPALRMAPGRRRRAPARRPATMAELTLEGGQPREVAFRAVGRAAGGRPRGRHGRPARPARSRQPRGRGTLWRAGLRAAGLLSGLRAASGAPGGRARATTSATLRELRAGRAAGRRARGRRRRRVAASAASAWTPASQERVREDCLL